MHVSLYVSDMTKTIDFYNAFFGVAPEKVRPGYVKYILPEPSLITIQPWDVSQIGPIERAIRSSDLGLNPSNDGKVVRLPIPQSARRRPGRTFRVGAKILSEIHSPTPEHPTMSTFRR